MLIWHCCDLTWNLFIAVGWNCWWLWWILSLCGRTGWLWTFQALSCSWYRRSSSRFTIKFDGFIFAGILLCVSEIKSAFHYMKFICSCFCWQVFKFMLQKANIIRDYLEDINEIPRSRMFWPREIWSKYADKLEVYEAFAFFCFSYWLASSMFQNDQSHIQWIFIMYIICSSFC